MKQDNQCKVKLFIDDDSQPIAELSTPVQFDLDTSKLTDGKHVLKIIGKSIKGRESIRQINFFVRNGPAIDIEGIDDNQIVDGSIPLMINAYDKGNLREFNIEGSETPKSIPSWLWIILIAFFGWAAYFIITYYNIPVPQP